MLSDQFSQAVVAAHVDGLAVVIGEQGSDRGAVNRVVRIWRLAGIDHCPKFGDLLADRCADLAVTHPNEWHRSVATDQWRDQRPFHVRNFLLVLNLELDVRRGFHDGAVGDPSALELQAVDVLDLNDARPVIAEQVAVSFVASETIGQADNFEVEARTHAQLRNAGIEFHRLDDQAEVFGDAVRDGRLQAVAPNHSSVNFKVDDQLAALAVEHLVGCGVRRAAEQGGCFGGRQIFFPESQPGLFAGEFDNFALHDRLG
ncbi:hypothetical protein D3C85_60080 [compost metagenome]